MQFEAFLRVDWGWIGELFGGGLGVDWHGLGWIGLCRVQDATYETQCFSHDENSENLGEQGKHILLFVQRRNGRGARTCETGAKESLRILQGPLVLGEMCPRKGGDRRGKRGRQREGCLVREEELTRGRRGGRA